jgi:CRP/FNR family cyclic AMP-dependent transcriptional regulator
MVASELSLERIINFLLDAPMFGDLDVTGLSQIVHILQVRELTPGEHVFREWDPGDAWYVLYAGEVEVLKESVTGPRMITRLAPRACFGEMAILDRSPRSASVRAVGDAVALRFPRIGFDELLSKGNIAAYKLVHQIALVLVARQRATTAQLVAALAGDEPLRERIEPILDLSVVAE